MIMYISKYEGIREHVSTSWYLLPSEDVSKLSDYKWRSLDNTTDKLAIEIPPIDGSFGYAIIKLDDGAEIPVTIGFTGEQAIQPTAVNESYVMRPRIDSVVATLTKTDGDITINLKDIYPSTNSLHKVYCVVLTNGKLVCHKVFDTNTIVLTGDDLPSYEYGDTVVVRLAHQNKNQVLSEYLDVEIEMGTFKVTPLSKLTYLDSSDALSFKFDKRLNNFSILGDDNGVVYNSAASGKVIPPNTLLPGSKYTLAGEFNVEYYDENDFYLVAYTSPSPATYPLNRLGVYPISFEPGAMYKVSCTFLDGIGRGLVVYRGMKIIDDREKYNSDYPYSVLYDLPQGYREYIITNITDAPISIRSAHIRFTYTEYVDDVTAYVRDISITRIDDAGGERYVRNFPITTVNDHDLFPATGKYLGVVNTYEDTNILDIYGDGYFEEGRKGLILVRRQDKPNDLTLIQHDNSIHIGDYEDILTDVATINSMMFVSDARMVIEVIKTDESKEHIFIMFDIYFRSIDVYMTDLTIDNVSNLTSDRKGNIYYIDSNLSVIKSNTLTGEKSTIYDLANDEYVTATNVNLNIQYTSNNTLTIMGSLDTLVRININDGTVKYLKGITPNTQAGTYVSADGDRNMLMLTRTTGELTMYDADLDLLQTYQTVPNVDAFIKRRDGKFTLIDSNGVVTIIN